MNATAKRNTRRVVTAGALGLALLAALPWTAQAFGRGGRHQPDPDRAVARLAEELSLTGEQQERVRAALEEGRTRRAALREAHRSEMETLREETHDALTAALSPEQAQKLDQLREERREHRDRRWEGKRRGEGWCRGDDPAAAE